MYIYIYAHILKDLKDIPPLISENMKDFFVFLFTPLNFPVLKKWHVLPVLAERMLFEVKINSASIMV